MTKQPKPLWAAMYNAYLANCTDGATVETDRNAWAAEIRAVADAIPESLYGAGGIRAWLHEEAQRAERGEG